MAPGGSQVPKCGYQTLVKVQQYLLSKITGTVNFTGNPNDSKEKASLCALWSVKSIVFITNMRQYPGQYQCICDQAVLHKCAKRTDIPLRHSG